MNYRILKDGEVVNTIVADEAFCEVFCAKHGYTYELVPEPEPVEHVPTIEEDTTAMLVDHEYRLTLLELGLTDI
jgi:hypothetical protein